jgi:hypothetical protein
MNTMGAAGLRVLDLDRAPVGPTPTASIVFYQLSFYASARLTVCPNKPRSRMLTG